MSETFYKSEGVKILRIDTVRYLEYRPIWTLPQLQSPSSTAISRAREMKSSSTTRGSRCFLSAEKITPERTKTRTKTNDGDDTDRTWEIAGASDAAPNAGAYPTAGCMRAPELLSSLSWRYCKWRRRRLRQGDAFEVQSPACAPYVRACSPLHRI